MSRQFVDASLAGCVPSRRYTTELNTLQNVMEDADLSANSYQSWLLSVDVPGFWMSGSNNRDYGDVVKTDDGYQWYSARMFVGPYGGLLLLMPWHGDREKKDGSTADRALQLHVFGNVEHAFIQQVLQKLLQRLTKLKEEIAANSK